MNVTDVLLAGVPSISTWADISEVIVEFAVIVKGVAWIEISAMEIVIDVDWFSVPHVAVIVAVPVSVPGVKVTVASTSSFVMAVL